MASVRWNHDPDRYVVYLRGYPKRLQNEIAEIVQETVDEGATLMHSKIDRIDTEYMKGAVAADLVDVSKTHISGWFGWGDDDVKPYFIYQEEGFVHARSGKHIPPMHALLEAFVETREKFFQKLEKRLH